MQRSSLDERDGGGDVSDTVIAAELGGLCIATAQEAGVDDASAVVPEAKLGEGLGEAAFIDVAEQSVVPEIGDADVEGKVDEGIELRLRECDGNDFIDALDSGAEVVEEQGYSLLLGDGLAWMDITGVSVADGPDTARVLVRGEDIAFKELGEGEPVPAVVEVIHAHLGIVNCCRAVENTKVASGCLSEVTLEWARPHTASAFCSQERFCIPLSDMKEMAKALARNACGTTLWVVVACISTSFWGVPARAQDARAEVRQDVQAEMAADAADHSVWIFRDDDQKPGNHIVQWVAQTHHGDVKRVIERNGRKVSELQQRRSIEAFIRDPEAQAKQRQAGQKDAKQADSLLKMLPDAFLWKEVSHNAKTTTFQFKPDPKFDPPDYQARVFAAMAGEMVVDNEQHRIEVFKGKMIRDVNFMWGILGSIKKGGWFEVDRSEIGPGIWEITESHIHIRGHVLFFKTISQQEDDVQTDFSRLPDDVTLEQAYEAVMKK